MIQLTPKGDFKKNRKVANEHSELMASKGFREAAKVALVEYQRQKLTGDVQNPAASSLKLKGAQEFLDVLMNLGEPEAKREETDTNVLQPPEEFGGWKTPSKLPITP